MSYKSPPRGHVSAPSVNPKRQPGKRSNQSASNAAKNVTVSLTDNYPSSDSRNTVKRVRPTVKDSIQRGYVPAGKTSPPVRPVGNTVKKIKG